MTRNFLLLKSSIGPEKYRRTRKELIMSPKMTGHFYSEKYRTAKNLLNVSEKKAQRTYNNCKELKVTRNFYH
jgi:hypothetical protein